MATNIDSVHLLHLDARLAGADWKRLRRTLKLPEDCFFHDVDDIDAMEDDKEYPLPNFTWRAEGSGRSFDDLKEVVGPCIKGRIDCVVQWEGGGPPSGLRIVNGLVEEPKVKYVFVDEEPR